MAELLVIVAVLAVLTWASVRLFPWRACPSCTKGRVYDGAGHHRDCSRCGSTGRVRRWGAGKEKR